MDAQVEQLIEYLVENGRAWVAEQRQLHRSHSRMLTVEESAALSLYFTASTVASVAIRDVELIDNPGFYAELAAKGIQLPLDFSQMDGITFVDTIVIARRRVEANSTPWISLLFHECVHVCQYKAIGIASFIKSCVEGWAQNGFNYFAIPLEVQAYRLQHELVLQGNHFRPSKLFFRAFVPASNFD